MAGQRVVFDSAGSYAESKMTGKRQYFKDKQGSYVLEMWLYDTENKDTCSCTKCPNEPTGNTDFIGQEVRHV